MKRYQDNNIHYSALAHVCESQSFMEPMHQTGGLLGQ